MFPFIIVFFLFSASDTLELSLSFFFSVSHRAMISAATGTALSPPFKINNARRNSSDASEAVERSRSPGGQNLGGSRIGRASGHGPDSLDLFSTLSAFSSQKKVNEVQPLEYTKRQISSSCKRCTTLRLHLFSFPFSLRSFLRINLGPRHY